MELEMFYSKENSRMVSNANYHLLFYLLIFVVFSVNISYCGDSLFFIFHGPFESGSPSIPNQLVIYCLNPDLKKLDPVWIPENNTEIQDIRIYYDDGFVIMRKEPTRLFIVPINAVRSAQSQDLPNLNWIGGYHYFSQPNGPGYLEVEYINKEANLQPKGNFAIAYFSIDNAAKEVEPKSMERNSELRLCGDDVVSFHKLSDIPSKPYDINIEFDGAPVPDSIVHMRNSYAWVMIANEPHFRAFLSVPERNGLIERELLIYNRTTSLWKSTMLEGAETSLRLINGWLVGRIADQSPKTDYTRRKGVPSLYREDVIFINPTNMQRFKVRLGGTISSVLMMDKDTVYYRIDQNVYKARLVDSGFVGSELILSDSRVFSIGRAFRGSLRTLDK
jgi:hypothetical protein